MKPFSQYEEKKLFILIAEGQENAFKIIFDRYKSKLYYFIKSIVKSDAVAEELVQEVFMRIWISRHALDRVETPDNYLFVMAKNRALDHLRKVINERKMLEQVQRTSVDYESTTEEQLLFNESKKLIDRAISLLPSQQQAVYLMARQEGFSRDQIAVELGISPNTVKNHLATAIKNIKKFLAHHNDMVFFLFFAGLIK